MQLAPIRKTNNKDGENAVNDQVNDGKGKVDCGMAELGSSVTKGEDRDGPFENPK
jgi:hypothetical protein